MKEFRVTLPGYDIDTAKPEEFSVNSDYPSPKISSIAKPLHVGTFDYLITSNPDIGTINILTIPHNYDFIPMNLCFLKDNQYWGFPTFTLLPRNFMYEFEINAYCDRYNFKIDLTRWSVIQDVTSWSFSFKYYIFAEEG